MTKLIGNDSATGSGSIDGNAYVTWARYIAIESGLMSYIKAHLVGSGSSAYAVYSDSSGLPGTLITSTSKAVCAAGWNNITLSSPISIISGAYYWIAVVSDANCIVSHSSGGVYKQSWVEDYNAYVFPESAPAEFDYSGTFNYRLSGWSSGGLPLIGPGLSGQSPLISVR